MVIAVVFTLATNIFSCASRFIVSHTKRRIVRLTPFIVTYFFINIPLIYRYLYFYKPSLMTRVNFLFSFLSSKPYPIDSHPIKTPQNPIGFEADTFYLIQSISAVLSAFFYAFHIPERYWPGKFDIIGQSHQFFHLAAFACTWSQFVGLRRDMRHLILQDYSEHHLNLNDEFFVLTDETVSFDTRTRIPFTDIKLSCLFIIFSCLVLNSIILVYFYFKAIYYNPWLKKNLFVRKSS